MTDNRKGKSEMMKSNGTKNGTWKMWATVGTFILIAMGAAMAYGILNEKVVTMEPEVKANSKHRTKFEEKVFTMEKNIEKILKIAEKNENQ